MSKRCSSRYQEILARLGPVGPIWDLTVKLPDVEPPFCDDVEAAIAQKQLLLEWHQSQMSGASPAQKAAHVQAMKQLQDEINALVAQLTICVERPPDPILAIAGVERTQCTQYFSINGQGGHTGADNTIPFVRNKPVVLRVYVDDRRPAPTRFPAGLQRRVSGSVRYQQAGSGPVSVLGPLNGSVPARPVAAVDRGNLNDTLNFRIPASDCRGTLQVTVDIADAFSVLTGSGLLADDNVTSTSPQVVANPTDSATFYLRFEPVPPFTIRVVLIHYTGAGLDIAPPSGLQFALDFMFTLATFPIDRLVFEECVVADFAGDLTDTSGGGCGVGWGQLMNLLGDLNAGASAICVGLLPNGVPRRGVVGCGGGGLAASVLNRSNVLAHEIGHALGRMHAPNPGTLQDWGPASPDPNYPEYPNYPLGSIGEFGVNCTDLTVFHPRYTLDLMSYTWLYYPAGWISPYTYLGIWNGMFARFGISQAALREDALQHQAWLYLRFIVDADGGVAVQPSFIRETPPIPVGGFGATAVVCELVNSAGRVVHTHRCRLRDPYQGVDDPSVSFYETIPWSPDVRTIRIRRDKEVLASIDVEETAPALTVAPPTISGRAVTLEWRADQSQDKPLTFIIEYSNDDGRTWRSVGKCEKRTRYEFPLDSLAGGERCRFRVSASAGIRTASAVSEAITIRQAARRAYILSPSPDSTIVGGEPVVFRGGGFAAGVGLTNPDEVLWHSSLDGMLGKGHEVVRRLSEGVHTITLTIADGLGGRVVTNITVIVASAEPPDSSRAP